MKNLWSDFHPLARAALFFVLVIAANIFYGGILLLIEGTEALDMSDMSSSKLKIYTFLNQIIGFLLPSLLIAYLIGNRLESGLKLKIPSLVLVLFSVLGIVVSLGFIGFIGEWNIEIFNQEGAFFEFCRNLEDQARDSMMGILKMDNYGTLAINILLIGLTPAICEEFAFRGVLQSQLHQSFQNHHLAIWLTAAIFSAIHFQFLGFFPRMLLGGLFGYLVVYTASLWPAILAHFINNSIGVIAYYVAMNTDLITMEQAENTDVAWYIALVSLALTLAVMALVKKLSPKKIKSI